MSTTQHTRQQMAASTSQFLHEKAERISIAWQRFTPRKLLAGLSLEEFRNKACGPGTESQSIHEHAERAELILSVLRAIEEAAELGRQSPFYLAVQEPSHPDAPPIPLAA